MRATWSSPLAFALLLGVATPSSHSRDAVPAAPRVLVVLSSDAQPYQDALTGLRHAAPAGTAFVVVALHGDSTRIADVLSAVGADPRPAVIVTFGTMATRNVLRHVTDLPVVAGMILNPAELDGAANATAVYLEYPVEVELEWMTRVLPGHHRIGIVYHAAEGGRRVEKARQLASIQAIHIDSPAELPDALQQLTNRADVLWSLNDPVVYNSETARSLLLFSLRNRIPMIGQSSAWVRAGALYALDRDYEDVGAQCAQLVIQVLAGALPADLAPVPPRKVRYAVNMRTATDIGLTLSDAVVRGAAEVVH